MNHLPEKLVLKTSLKKQFLLIFICLAFVAIGVWMVMSGEWLGWLGIVFFGGGFPILILQMIRGGRYLRIDSNGIAIGTGRKEETKYQWNDIEAFGVTKIGGNKFVSWNFATDYERSKTARKLNLSLSNGTMEAMLPDTYGFKAIELSTLLNEYKQNQTLQTTSASRRV